MWEGDVFDVIIHGVSRYTDDWVVRFLLDMLLRGVGVVYRWLGFFSGFEDW